MMTQPVDPRFIGFYAQGGIITTVTNQYCDADQYFSSSGDYWACCYSTATAPSCLYSPSCVGTASLEDSNGATGGCLSGYGCRYQTVFATYPDTSPMTKAVCAVPEFSAQTLYRVIPSTSSSSVSQISTSDSATAAATITSSTAVATSATASASASAIPSSGGSSSKAWIAGPVVGGVVAIVAIIAFLVWFMRRRKRQTGQPQTYGQSPVMHEDQPHYQPYYASDPKEAPPDLYTQDAASNRRSELPANSAPAELPGERMR